jgi:hypothetical protein
MGNHHLDQARRELRTRQPRAADEHHQRDSLLDDEKQELINLLSVAFRHAPEPVLEYSFGVLSYSFAPFFVCLLVPWFAVVSLSKTALSWVDDFSSEISCGNVIDCFTLIFINWGQNKLMQKPHLLFYAIFTQFSFNSGEVMRKSHRLFKRIFDQLGTKQIYRNVIDVFTQFFINWDQTDLVPVSKDLVIVKLLGKVMNDFEHPAAIDESKAVVKGFIPPSQKFSKKRISLHHTLPSARAGEQE